MHGINEVAAIAPLVSSNFRAILSRATRSLTFLGNQCALQHGAQSNLSGVLPRSL